MSVSGYEDERGNALSILRSRGCPGKGILEVELWLPRYIPNQTSRCVSIQRSHPEALMWFKHRAWIPVAWLLSAANLGAVWFAAVPAEPLHATTHALFAVLLALGARHLMTRQQQPQPVDDSRLERLQEGMDVIALEIERISEGQRYVTRILNERLQQSVGAGDAQGIPVDRKNVAPARSRSEEP
jgi:hypothetical protein